MSLPANSKLSCDPVVIAALGLPPGDWIFSDASDSYVLALPAGTFFPASNFRGKGFVLMPGKPPEPDSCCNFFDGGEMSAESVLSWLGSKDRSMTEEGGAPGGAISGAETLKNHHEKPANVQSDPVPNPILSDKFAEAVAYAVHLHREHPRKGTTIPYASHLLAVASLVLEHGGSEIQAIAALLHDSIEDCAGSDPAPLKREIREKFGGDVLRIVEGCSDSERSVGKLPWRVRKHSYLAGIRKKNPATLLVSLADKTHNARCIATDQDAIGEAVWERFSVPKAAVIWYYESLLTAFSASQVSAPGLLAELRIAVERMRAGPSGAAPR